MSISVLALEKDLFFSVKIRDTLRHYDVETAIARTLAAFEQRLLDANDRPSLAIIDIAIPGVDWEAAIKAARAQELPVLAFGSHMDLDARRKALQAGANKVVANSKFSSDMMGLINRLLQGPNSVDTEEQDEEEDG